MIVTACFGKIVGTVSAALLSKVGLRDSLVLGVLMNTRGLAELIVLNIGKDRKVFSLILNHYIKLNNNLIMIYFM